MREPRKIYGWESDDMGGNRAFLSPYPATWKDRPFNRYASREEAEAHAKGRNCKIEWEN